MVDTEKLSPLLPKQEFDIRLEGAAVVGEILSSKGRFRNPWFDLGEDMNHEGVHATMGRFTDFLTYITERRTVVDQEESREVNKVLATPNQGVAVIKKTAQGYRAMGDDEEYFKFPKWDSDGWKAAYRTWGMHHEPGDSADGKDGSLELFSTVVFIFKLTFE